MKKLAFVALLLATQITSAQKYFTRTGNTEFLASVESFERVGAENHSTTAVLKAETGDLAALLLVKAFKFEIALMQEHFNENYMDSDKFPKATFKGKLVDFNINDIDTEKTYDLSGTLTVRGIKKKVITPATVLKKDGKIYIKANFSVKPQEFNIDIPSVVREKIAKEINISIDYALAQRKKK